MSTDTSTPASSGRSRSGVRVLFVCAGNTCRSPMAEAIARSRVDDAGLVFASAGWRASEGAPAAANATDVVGADGGGLTAHSARPLTRELVEQADVVVALDGGALDAAQALGGDGKARLLTATGVVDPYGGSPDEYRRTRDEIRSAVEALLAELGA